MKFVCTAPSTLAPPRHQHQHRRLDCPSPAASPRRRECGNQKQDDGSKSSTKPCRPAASCTFHQATHKTTYIHQLRTYWGCARTVQQDLAPCLCGGLKGVTCAKRRRTDMDSKEQRQRWYECNTCTYRVTFDTQQQGQQGPGKADTRHQQPWRSRPRHVSLSIALCLLAFHDYGSVNAIGNQDSTDNAG